MRTTLIQKLITGGVATLTVVGWHWLGLHRATAAQAGTRAPAAPMEQDAGRAPAPGEQKTSRYPIRGKLKAVDANAQTITLSGTDKDRVFKVTPQTELLRDGKPATLSDARIGDAVGGLVERQADGNVVALKVRFGPKPEAEQKSTTKPKRQPASSTAKTADSR